MWLRDEGALNEGAGVLKGAKEPGVAEKRVFLTRATLEANDPANVVKWKPQCS
jgi:hypothetical protein